MILMMMAAASLVSAAPKKRRTEITWAFAKDNSSSDASPRPESEPSRELTQSLQASRGSSSSHPVQGMSGGHSGGMPVSHSSHTILGGGMSVSHAHSSSSCSGQGFDEIDEALAEVLRLIPLGLLDQEDAAACAEAEVALALNTEMEAQTLQNTQVANVGSVQTTGGGGTAPTTSSAKEPTKGPLAMGLLMAILGYSI
jgi:hypothetical protein